MRRHVFIWTIVLAAIGGYSDSALKLDSLFMDNMVLQRNKPIPVFGTATPGQEIMVEFNGQKQSGLAGANGEWQVELAPMKADATGQPLSVFSQASSLKSQISNVLIGDVWLCGGQSNMDTPINSYPFLKKELSGVSNSKLRLFVVEMKAEPCPKDTVSSDPVFSTWKEADSEAISHFSAVGTCFGLRLQQESGVPIGLIESAVGGSQIQPWIPAEKLESMGFGSIQAPQDRGVDGRNQPCAYYNGMIHALRRLPIKGVIWYQGESNAGHPSIVCYDQLFKGLISSWREAFGLSEMRFYFVQLAPYGRTGWDQSGESWAFIREAQESVLSMPHTGRAVITDLGEYVDIHPADKRPVGERLADIALRDMSLIDSPGFPMVGNFRISEGRVQVSFSNVGNGLKPERVAMNNKAKLAPGTDPEAFVVEAGEVAGFTICGADEKFVPAQARIVDADTVEVWSDAVSEPIAVRYGWENFPLCNLANSDGLPASPFRTDDFPMPIFRAPILERRSADEPLPAGAVRCAAMKKSDESLLTPEIIQGRDALRVNHVETVMRMAYFYAEDRDSALRQGKHPKQTIVVNYLDDGPGTIELKYDSISKPWKSAGIIEIKGSGEWRRFSVELEDARFAGRCNGADIRLESFRDFHVSGVYVIPE
ncbi:hypothetical protein PDESU_01825 [Pontiella desulfatans]|uniref:Sialate O-acetylesterase domain-containing protein n=1 Tax=Pontiella desulfatans TaxID=2750659 RepID=A0A6C2U0C3_PONDE|nr:sialate O-acetylesterase [Pontiella desulfatans]VGO13269.1 hypothetical protein PDESU_01825 [Pontiella desulfatans]